MACLMVMTGAPACRHAFCPVDASERPNPCHFGKSRPANETGVQIHGPNLRTRSVHLP